MAIDPEDAAASLSDVARVETRTRQAVRHAVSGQFFVMWGVLTAIGHVVGYVRPDFRWYSWIVVMAVGILGGFAIIFARARRTRRAPREMRLIYALLVFVAYGVLWTAILGQFTPRQLEAFWPTLFMLGFVAAGFWVGRFFIGCGLLATALIVGGYFWAGDWYGLWLAAVEGGGMVVGGLYLLRVGIER